jgi:hypothetical protein
MARERHIANLREQLSGLQDEHRGLEIQLDQHRNAAGRLKDEQYRIK